MLTLVQIIHLSHSSGDEFLLLEAQHQSRLLSMSINDKKKLNYKMHLPEKDSEDFFFKPFQIQGEIQGENIMYEMYVDPYCWMIMLANCFPLCIPARDCI